MAICAEGFKKFMMVVFVIDKEFKTDQENS